MCVVSKGDDLVEQRLALFLCWGVLDPCFELSDTLSTYGCDPFGRKGRMPLRHVVDEQTLGRPKFELCCRFQRKIASDEQASALPLRRDVVLVPASWLHDLAV